MHTLAEYIKLHHVIAGASPTAAKITLTTERSHVIAQSAKPPWL